MRGDPEVLEFPARYEGRVPGLGVTRAREHFAGQVEPAVEAGRKRRPAFVAPARQRRRNSVVSVDTPYLLDEVLWDGDVETKHRRQHVPLAVAHHLDVKVEPLEDRLRLFQRHMCPQHVVDERGTKVDSNRFLRARIDIGPVLVDRAARQLGNQRRGAPRAGQRELGRQGSLEPRRGFGSQPDRA